MLSHAQISATTQRVLDRIAATGGGPTCPAKRALAAEFARRRGWRIGRPFDLPRLLRQPTPRRFDGCRPGFGQCEWFDHPVYFWNDRRPAGLAIQPYRAIEAGLFDWAARNGLRAEHVQDYPAWWFPGRTSLVLLTPAGAAPPDGR